jgi:hypothetical protein
MTLLLQRTLKQAATTARDGSSKIDAVAFRGEHVFDWRGFFVLDKLSLCVAAARHL